MRSFNGSTSFLLFRPPFGAQNKGYQHVVENYLIANWPYEAQVQEGGRWTAERLDEYAKQDELPPSGLPVLRIYTGLVPWNDHIITAIYPELREAVRLIWEQKQNDFNHRVIKAIQSVKLQPWDLSMLEMLRGDEVNRSIVFVPFWLITCPNCPNRVDVVRWLNSLKGEAFGALQPGTLRMLGALYKEHLQITSQGNSYNPNFIHLAMSKYARTGITSLEQPVTDGIVHTPRTSKEFNEQMGRLIKALREKERA